MNRVDNISGETIKIAIEEHLFEYIRAFARVKTNEFFEDENLLSYISGFDAPSMFSNCVYRAKFSEGSADDKIDSVLSIFKEKSVPVLWTTGPSSEPVNLGDLLKKHGMMHVQRQRGMALDMNELETDLNIPHELEIKEVDNRETLRDWIKMLNICFEQLPELDDKIIERYEDFFFDESIPMNHYIGYINGRPAGTSTVFSHGGVAGLYNIVTLPEARRRGVAEAMTGRALIRGRELGDKISILQATDAGALVYSKMGFREYNTFDLYVKLYGKSMVTVPFSFVKIKISNYLRSRFIRM